MVLGTHNSCTGYPLKGWSKLLYPLAWLTARCQSKSLTEQWKAGVRYFNLQVAWNGKEWYLSHGIVLYDITLWEALAELDMLSHGEKIYVEIILDHNFFHQELPIWFEVYVERVMKTFSNITLVRTIIEKTWTVKHYLDEPLNLEEHYWTMTWAKDKPWWYKLPVPVLWARLFNKRWKEECGECDVVMMDFV